MNNIKEVDVLSNPTLINVVDNKDNSAYFNYCGNAEVLAAMLDSLLEIVAKDNPAIIDRLLTKRLKKWLKVYILSLIWKMNAINIFMNISIEGKKPDIIK